VGPPEGIGIVDLMLGVPSDRAAWTAAYERLVKDAGSHELRHPAGYMFTELPEVDPRDDFVAFLVAEMDRWGIEQGLLPVAEGDEWGRRAVAEHPGRLHGCLLVDPNRGVAAVAELRRAVADLGVVAAALFPAGLVPQRAISDPCCYPLYAACCELGLPVFVNVGVPGPRFPMGVQHVEHLDTVMADFPELVVVMRHGGEPWEALAVALMRRWPNLHYSTSAFAPRHYPTAIVDYANADGADRVLYAGYFPMGLSLERIMTDMPNVPFKDDVWPKFLRENARKVLKL